MNQACPDQGWGNQNHSWVKVSGYRWRECWWRLKWPRREVFYLCWNCKEEQPLRQGPRS